MALTLKRTLQPVILAALGYFVLDKIRTGRLTWYINERYLLLTLAGALGLVGLALFSLFEGRPGEPHEHHSEDQPDHAHPHTSAADWLWLIVALPAVLAFLVPARPLGSSAVANKGVSATVPLSAGGNAKPVKLDLAPTQRTILDWIRAFNYESDPSVLEGQSADVVGFIFHDARLAPGQFFVGRFAITCCVADASAIGMIVDYATTETLPDNQWVRVRGTVSSSSLNGQPIPRLQASSVEKVEEPANPYLYP